jgi:hypothetical protein
MLATSTMLVQVPIQATLDGEPYDPTGDVVSMAFVVGSGQPASFNSGSWQTTVQGYYLAQCLVGPENGGVVLAPATYGIFVKIVDNPEVPILPAGSLQIV